MSTQQPNLKLQALSALLRDKSRWPADFGPWNYRNWECCAIGLAYKAGILSTVAFDHEFNLASRDFDAIFAMAPISHSCTTTPEQVADQIDNHLAGRHEATIEARHGWRMAFAVDRVAS